MRSDLGRGELGFEVSHPCAKKNAQGWGTQQMGCIEMRDAGPSTTLRFAHCQDAGPSTTLRFAQDDKLLVEGCR